MCDESSDSSCEQWQVTDGQQPYSDRRAKKGCRGRRETNPEVQRRTSEDEQWREHQRMSHQWMTKERRETNPEVDRTEHQAKNRDENIVGREQQR